MRNFFSVMDNSNKPDVVRTAQNARLDIIGELEAIVMYQNHFDETSDIAARRTIEDIMTEEKLHVGQLFGLLFSLDSISKEMFEKGYNEFMNENIKK